MQIIIVGAGRVGRGLTQELLNREEDCVLIDQSPAQLQLAEGIPCPLIEGVPIDFDVLKSAGIETADFVIAVTDDDNINLSVAQIAQDIFGVKRVLARLHNRRKTEIYKQFNIETICSTDLIMSDVLRRIYREETRLSHRFFDKNLHYHLIEAGDDIVGAALSELVGLSEQIVVGILRGEHFYLFNEALTVEKNDRIVLLEAE